MTDVAHDETSVKVSTSRHTALQEVLDRRGHPSDRRIQVMYPFDRDPVTHRALKKKAMAWRR